MRGNIGVNSTVEASRRDCAHIGAKHLTTANPAACYSCCLKRYQSPPRTVSSQASILRVRGIFCFSVEHGHRGGTTPDYRRHAGSAQSVMI